mmetsp:Transcript_34061/g.82630  ORF Transcript_34061/g.82630 Transcript_34061/m.82630 type:complete len:88 (-) Transcript_34061:1476-1739(-)
MTSNGTINPDSISNVTASDAEKLRKSVQPSSEMMLVPPTNRIKKLVDSKLKDLTINKLKIQSVGLIGRETETERLQSCLKSIGPTVG